MSRRLKIIIALAAAILLVTTGIAVPAIAQEDSSTRTFQAESSSYLARVAEILGNVSEEDLTNAFEEAQQELREDAFSRIIDKALEKGLISEDEATAIKEWWQQRPESLKRISILPFGKTAQPVHPSGSGSLLWSRPVITRAAGILGIAEEDLANALKEARQEMINELSGRIRNNAAQKGRIRQENTANNRQRLEQDNTGAMKRPNQNQIPVSGGASLNSGTY